MSLLDLPAEVWTSYVVPLAELSSMVRLTCVSRASRDLAQQALQRLPSIAIVAPSDLHACLTWMRNRSICIDQLIIDRDHQDNLGTVKKTEFSTCYQEIALKISKTSSDITGVYDTDMLLLLHIRLTVLEIETPEAVPATLMENCLGCRNLHSITYTMFQLYTSCNQDWLVKMIKNSPSLRKLHIGQGYCFSNEVVAAIAERKDTLTDMTVFVGTFDPLNGREHAQLRRLIESCPSLRKLTFWVKEGTHDHGDGLVGMEGKCPHLEELVLHHINFSGDSLLNFILSCPKLRVCQADSGFIGNLDRIKDQDLERWHRQGWPILQHFGLGSSVKQLETVVACATLFEEVRTYHMYCAGAWETAAEALTYMPHLHTVCLYANPAGLLPYLTRYCSQLRVLRIMVKLPLAYSGEIGLALVAALPSLSKLEVLQWRLTTGFGEAGLMALAQYFPNLRSLDCSCCEVTDAGLIALVRGCPALRTLVVKGGREGWVIDAFLHAIAQHCPYLEELGLPKWGRALPASAVTEVLVSCKHLRVLQVPRTLKDGIDSSILGVPTGRLRRLTITAW